MDCKVFATLDAIDHLSDDIASHARAVELSVALPSAGILTLEVTVPNAATATPWLGEASPECAAAGTAAVRIERSASHQVLAIESPGIYYFRVGALDPHRALGSYHLTSRFVAAEVVSTEFYGQATADFIGNDSSHTELIDFYALHRFDREKPQETLDPDPIPSRRTDKNEQEEFDPDPIPSRRTDKNEQEEFDPDPIFDPFGSRGGQLLLSIAKLDFPPTLHSDPAEFDTDLEERLHNPTTDLELEEQRRVSWVLSPEERRALAARNQQFDLHSMASSGQRGRILRDSSCAANTAEHEMPGYWLGALRGCRQAWADDHADAFSCATPLKLGHIVDARIGHPRGDDDADVFVFSVPEFATIDIMADGAVATGALYNDEGHRLATDTMRHQDGVHIARSLSPGTYFVRLESDRGMPEDYRLSVTTRDW